MVESSFLGRINATLAQASELRVLARRPCPAARALEQGVAADAAGQALIANELNGRRAAELFGWAISHPL